ncbi:MAG: hypothetical protein NUV56_03760 [Candidatus Uhrbacteria bacterium]|nr:hypothetical protein [Candidatus Uhrbacteria bacterium]
MFNFSKRFRVLYFAMIMAMILPLGVRATTIADLFDNPTSTTISTAVNHLITMTLATGFDDGETLTITFESDFATTTVTEDDVDITDDGVDLTTAADCTGSEQASVAMASRVLTFTICAGDGGSIATGSVVAIEIGTSASASGSGTNRITNPTVVGTYYLNLAGTFGDSGSAPIGMTATSGSGVAFSVPAADTGGGGGSSSPGTPPAGDDEEADDSDAPIIPEVDPEPIPEPEPDPEPVADPAPDTPDTDTGEGALPSGEDTAGDVGQDAPSSGGTSGSVDTDSSSGGSSPQPETGEIDVVGDEGTTDGGGLIPQNDDVVPDTTDGSVPTEDSEQPSVREEVPGSVTQITDALSSYVPVAVTQAIARIEAAIEAVREIPHIQEAASVATPVAVAAAVASTAVLVSSFSLVPYLHYLITSPILFFWRRKRKNFGIVYNAMTKVAIDLATVRLYDGVTGRLLRSAVTDREGKYYFAIHPGRYRLVAVKPRFAFPSAYLVGVKDDGAYLDVYTGQEIEVTNDSATIAANIPLDPADQQSPVAAGLRLKRVLRGFQYAFALSGVGVSIAVYVLQPSRFTLIMVGVQLVVFAFVKRLARPRKPKGWGIVYDGSSRKPVGNTVVRLFEPKYNKLVETTLTDNLGRYAFVLGPNEYFVSFTKKGYKEAMVRPLDYRDKKEPTSVAVDVPLEREGGV